MLLPLVWLQHCKDPVEIGTRFTSRLQCLSLPVEIGVVSGVLGTSSSNIGIAGRVEVRACCSFSMKNSAFLLVAMKVETIDQLAYTFTVINLSVPW